MGLVYEDHFALVKHFFTLYTHFPIIATIRKRLRGDARRKTLHTKEGRKSFYHCQQLYFQPTALGYGQSHEP